MPLRPNFIERLLIRWGMIPGPLIDMGLPSFIASAMIGAGEIELFQELDDSPGTLEQLASRTGTDRRALKNLLRTLQPVGYVEENNGKYALTDYARKTVPVDTFTKMVPMLKEQMVNNITNVEQALREAPEEGVFGWEKVKGGELGQSYQELMRWLASGTVEEVCKKLKLPKGGKRMLDVGGSHGLYCVEMCRKYPGLEATVLDWPIGIENAKETLRKETDVAGRIDTLEADFHEDPFPEGYDLAFLGNIIHGNSPGQNKHIFRKLGDSTTGRGTVGIVDQFDNLSGSRFTRSVAALLGWNLFLFSNGRAYEIEQVKSWLREAGFADTKVKSLRKSPGFTLLIASK